MNLRESSTLQEQSMVDWTELERLHAKATSGEWNIDTEKNEGDYGSGDPDDARTGFESYVLHAPSGSICDTLNSDLIEVMEESDGEGDLYAWDAVGERNIKWIAAIHNAWPSILAKLEAAQRFINHVEGEVACFLGSGDDGVIGDENVLRAVTIMHKRKIAADNFYRRIKEIYDSGNVGKLEDALAAFDKEQTEMIEGEQ